MKGGSHRKTMYSVSKVFFVHRLTNHYLQCPVGDTIYLWHWQWTEKWCRRYKIPLNVFPLIAKLLNSGTTKSWCFGVLSNIDRYYMKIWSNKQPVACSMLVYERKAFSMACTDMLLFWVYLSGKKMIFDWTISIVQIFELIRSLRRERKPVYVNDKLVKVNYLAFCM